MVLLHIWVNGNEIMQYFDLMAVHQPIFLDFELAEFLP